MVLRLMYASINYLAVYTLYSTDSVVLEDANIIVGSKTKRNIYKCKYGYMYTIVEIEMSYMLSCQGESLMMHSICIEFATLTVWLLSW